MVNKNMRNIYFTVFMTFLIILIGVSTTITSATINRCNAITFGDLSEENEKTININNENEFYVNFGFIVAETMISKVVLLPEDNYYIFYCEPVIRVTFIGFGSYNNPNLNERFYMKTLYNVSLIWGCSFKEVEVSEEYQTIFSFHTPLTPCILYFD